MIKSIVIQNFMGYGAFRSGDFGQLNVFIGQNDTGKTALLKLLYTAVRTVDIYTKDRRERDVALKRVLAEKLTDVYQPGKKGLGELVNKTTKEKLSVDVEFRHEWLGYADRLHFSFGDSTTTTINDCQDTINPLPDSIRSVFIPAKEVLTPLKAIRATRDNLRMSGFDDTYLDLIRALVIPTQKGKITEELSSVNRKLEALFEGQVEQRDDDDFVFKKGNTEFPIQLTAEGIKKIGILTTLIRNRQLNAQSVLFMDEPETALHPEAIIELAEMLTLMTKAGIQVFVATHNYFVLKQLYLCVRREKLNAFCFSLNREKGRAIEAQKHDLNTVFPENAISDAAIKMADQETDLDLGLF